MAFYPNTGVRFSNLPLRFLIPILERSFHACFYGFISQTAQFSHRLCVCVCVLILSNFAIFYFEWFNISCFDIRYNIRFSPSLSCQGSLVGSVSNFRAEDRHFPASPARKKKERKKMSCYHNRKKP